MGSKFVGPTDEPLWVGSTLGEGLETGLGLCTGTGLADWVGAGVGLTLGVGFGVGAITGGTTFGAGAGPDEVGAGGGDSTTTVSALDAADVWSFKFWVAVIDQVPVAKVPRVHEAVPATLAAEVVQVTFEEDAFVAVTVAVAPSVRPVRSIVGVES